MNTRRDFLSVTVKGSAMAVATALLPRSSSASGASDMIGSNSMEQSVRSGNKGHYKPPFRFGIGGVPLGNEFAVVTDKDAYATIEAAWNAGVRYYDMAPWYGLGLAERRYGNILQNKNRSEYVSPRRLASSLKHRRPQRIRSISRFLPRRTMWSTITRRPACDVPLKTICKGSVLTAWTSPSCMTSRRTTNIFRHPGRSSSRSLERAHFLSSRVCGKRD